ncbi:MAG: MmyB family transcriptional regulator, partial [Chloroflexota bacterium]
MNLGETLRSMAVRLRTESRHVGGDARLDEFAARLEADPAAAAAAEDGIGLRHPFTAVRLRGEAGELAFLTATAELGTAESITVRDLHLELFFPADDSTRAAFEA